MPVYGLPTALESSLNSLLEHSRPSSWRVSGHGDDVTVVLRWSFCGSATSEKTLDYDEFTPAPETSHQRSWCEREIHSRAVPSHREPWQGEDGQTRGIVNGTRSAKKDRLVQGSRMRRKHEPYPSTVTAMAKASAAAAATTAIATVASNRGVSPVPLFVTNSSGVLHSTSSAEPLFHVSKPSSVPPPEAPKKQRQRTHSEELRQIALLQRTPFRHNHSTAGGDAFGETPDTKAVSPYAVTESASSLINGQQYAHSPRPPGATPRSYHAVEKKSPSQFNRPAPVASPPKLSPLTDDLNDNRDNNHEEMNNHNHNQDHNLVERHNDHDEDDDDDDDGDDERKDRRNDVQNRLHDDAASTHNDPGSPDSRTVAAESHESPSHESPSRESLPHDLDMACCSADQDQCRIYVNSDANSLSWDSFESVPDSAASELNGADAEPRTPEKCE